MEQKYCYILDFGSGMLYCLHLECSDKKPEDFEDNEDLIRYWGFNPDQCHWMFSDEELSINHIVLPLK